MKTLMWITLGGAGGTALRYLLGGIITPLAGGTFPLGTFTINVLGSFAVGAFGGHFMNMQTQPELRAALIIGLCGGFTTFSAFSYETIGLLEGGRYWQAFVYVGLSVGLSLLATLAGMVVAGRVS